MQFVELTRKIDGDVIAINLALVEVIAPENDGASIYFQGQEKPLRVSEDFIEIRKRLPSDYWFHIRKR